MNCFIFQKESSSQGRYPAANYLSLSTKQTDLSDTYSDYLNSFSSSVSSSAAADSLTIDTAESRVDPASAAASILGDITSATPPPSLVRSDPFVFTTFPQSVPEIDVADTGDFTSATPPPPLVRFHPFVFKTSPQSVLVANTGSKNEPTWTAHVKVRSDGLEEPYDGFTWRNYGHKAILGAKYPRRYYSCTYKFTQRCWAKKQVQRSDEDPTIFEITYSNEHTCAHGKQVEKQEQEQNNNQQRQQQAQAQPPVPDFSNF